MAHWNSNSITAQIFVKLSQLEAYNAMPCYDPICLSETWLDSTTSIDSNHLSLTVTTYIMLTIMRGLRLL